jgi:hypothetical protein
MEECRVYRILGIFCDLKPVARIVVPRAGYDVVARTHPAIEYWERGLLVRWSHVYKHSAGSFMGGVCSVALVVF